MLGWLPPTVVVLLMLRQPLTVFAWLNSYSPVGMHILVISGGSADRSVRVVIEVALEPSVKCASILPESYGLQLYIMGLHSADSISFDIVGFNTCWAGCRCIQRLIEAFIENNAAFISRFPLLPLYAITLATQTYN